jgi:hypothetical protein
LGWKQNLVFQIKYQCANQIGEYQFLMQPIWQITILHLVAEEASGGAKYDTFGSPDCMYYN